jgi:hypothetical protein
MEINTREDIAASIEAVFEHISDFDWFERAALRRGAEIVRIDTLKEPAPGMKWRAEFDYRGRVRKANVELTEYDKPNGMRALMHSAGLEMDASIELVAMSKTRTRLNIIVKAEPQTIPARLMIQSAKLARTSIQKRFRRRIAEYSAELEERCQARGV